VPRKYDMAGRTAAMQHTRERILDAVTAMSDAWYDEVTLGDLARAAGVSQQTVVNHFGSKTNLYLAAIAERFAPEITSLRAGAVPGDVDAIVAAVVRDYEVSGDRTWRMVALAGRLEELRPVAAAGRRAHREFVEEFFGPLLPRPGTAARDRLVTLLATALDVGTWRQLRRDEGLSEDQSRDHLRQLVGALLRT
jgi:AcrR family transcriptional regulator